jgi:outer membrane receptor for ferrienterochelin and colicins
MNSLIIKNAFFICFAKRKALLLLLFLVSTGLFGQNITLQSAKSKFDIGQFEQSKADLIKLIEGFEEVSKSKRSTKDQKINALQDKASALQLLTTIFLVTDSLEKAEYPAQKLLDDNPGFETRREDNPLFIDLISLLKNRNKGVEVFSVSKNAESLYEAPATVTVITQQEILERGYLDLEMLVHDLAGFDVTRTAGIIYSHIYQRGYRANNTTRMLLLIDGVEENDLWGNIAYLARQYPLSNIKRVEVVYGPASTVYGANAFSGVINVITKNPDDLIGEDKKFGIQGQVSGGTYNTRYVDLTGAYKVNPNISGSVTFRYFESDERDLGDLENFDYKLDHVNYKDVLSVTESNPILYDSVIKSVDPSLYSIEAGTNKIVPNESAVNLAKRQDDNYLNNVQYENYNKSTFISAKVKLYDLTLGFEHWQKEQGIGGWATENYALPSSYGQVWIPTHTMFYSRYASEIVKEKLNFVNFTRYKLDALQDPTAIIDWSGYGNGRLNLTGLSNINNSNFSPLNAYSDTLDIYYYLKSNQLRNETQLFYSPNSDLSIMSGVEFRLSSIQGDYIKSSKRPAEELGQGPADPGGNQYFSTAFGVYTQADYRINKSLKLTGGLRYDYNRIRQTLGYKNVWNPRLAVVYQVKSFTLKGIYSEAFKDPSNFDRYSTSGTRTEPNPNLKPEKVRNIEFSSRWVWNKKLNTELVVYKSFYSSAVELVGNRHESSGQRDVFGIQLESKYDFNEKFSMLFNYTYTDPREYEKNGNVIVDTVRVADIARSSANLIANYRLKKGLNINLRSNAVGSRPTGPGTSVMGNNATFDPYVIFHGAIMYSILKNEQLTFQLTVNNIFNLNYYSPGIRAGDNIYYVSKVPQNLRTINFKLFLKI